MNSLCTLTLNPCIDVHDSVPSFRLNGVNHSTKQVLRLGGKGINVSRAVQKAAQEAGVKLTTIAIGGTATDALMLKLARVDGVELTLIPGATEPRLNLHVREQAGEKRLLKVNAPGGSVKPEVLEAVAQKIEQHKPSCLVLAGSLPPGLPVNSYARLIENAKRWGCKTVVDCRDLPLQAALQSQPGFIKINLEELAVLIPGITESTLARLLPPFAKAHNTRFCITNGGGLITYADGETLIQQQPPPMSAGETVGAGDAFLAGWIAGEFQRRAPQDCLSQAINYATQYVQNSLKSLGATNSDSS